MPYQKQVSDWLKAPDQPGVESALADIRRDTNPSRVWLYRKSDGILVGFGAMVDSEWRWTSGKDPWIPVSAITWCAVHEDYQGESHEPKNERYANQIMEDLIGQAEETKLTRPVLGLFVHSDNERAINFYNRFKFTSEGLIGYTEKDTGICYQKMALILDPAALLEFLNLKKMKKG